MPPPPKLTSKKAHVKGGQDSSTLYSGSFLKQERIITEREIEIEY